MVSIFECTQKLVFSDVPKIAFAARVSTNIVNLITQDNDSSLSLRSLFMLKTSRLILLSSLAAVATQVMAGVAPVPGPEFGEGSIGLLALGISTVAYAIYKHKNKK